jgi:hypothetical protein
VAHEIAGIEDIDRRSEQQSIGVHLISLPCRQISTPRQPISELVDRALRPRQVAPQIHSPWRAHQHRKRELLGRRQGVEAPVEV